MLQRSQNVRPKTSALGISTIESTARKNSREKFLCEFLRRILLASFALKESQHRLVIRLAQFAQRTARLNTLAPRAQDERPARGCEASIGRIRIQGVGTGGMGRNARQA